MKTILLTLFVFLAFSPVFGQKKSKVDPKDTRIDSLTVANQNLTLQLDSVSAELVKYFGVYTVVKEKVIKYDFDPTRMSYLIDSLKSARDSAFAKLIPVPQTDSILALKNEIRMLKAANESISVAGAEKVASLTTEEIERAKAMSNLKELKGLLDAGIITEAEFITMKKKYLDKL